MINRNMLLLDRRLGWARSIASEDWIRNGFGGCGRRERREELIEYEKITCLRRRELLERKVALFDHLQDSRVKN